MDEVVCTSIPRAKQLFGYGEGNIGHKDRYCTEAAVAGGHTKDVAGLVIATLS